MKPREWGSPFLQRAFTISFDRGTLYANNNIVGIGKTGGGLGIDVGYYDALRAACRNRSRCRRHWLI